MYLDFAELQALNRRLMYMKDWIAKLDDFMRLSERDILTHAGKISHDAALAKADSACRLVSLRVPTDTAPHRRGQSWQYT